MDIKKYLNKLYRETAFTSRDNIVSLLKQSGKGGILLDVGCWDGTTTLKWAKAVSAKENYGIEIILSAARKASKRGIKVYGVDIDRSKWPFKNNTFDYVISNMVIEHLVDVDHFISESFRVLKKGAVTVVSTNNLSSWHNIGSLLFGWAPFDLTNSSSRRWSIGNPFALHGDESSKFGQPFTHKCIYTARWLKEWYELFGFKHVETLGAGYFPFNPILGKFDKLHSALITLKFVKP